MKKRKFLVPLAVSVAALTLPVTPEASISHTPGTTVQAPSAPSTIADGFVIERSDARGAQMAYHQSHRSHSSHRSHYSHRSHVSGW